MRSLIAGILLIALLTSSLLPVAAQSNPQVFAASQPSVDNPVYSGGRIIFVSYRGGDSQIHAMEPDGSNQVNLSGTSANDSAPVVGPDGRIAFISARDGNQELYVMDGDGGNQIRLTHSSGDEGFPDWSPDGSALVVQYRAEDMWQLLKIQSDGSSQQVLFQNTADVGQPDWSPDGSQIAFYWNHPVQPGIYLLPRAGGTPVYTNIGHQFPRWSPDGDRLAFVALALGGTYGRIGVANTDSTASVTWVSPGQVLDSHPRWSPDGRRILFDSTYMGFHQIYLAMADGSTAGSYLNLSASGASDWMADWSPLGQVPPAAAGPYVAYQMGGANEPGSIHLYNSETGQTRMLVEADDLRLAGMWERWVVYQQGNAYGGYDVHAYDLESDQAHRISSASTMAMQNRPLVDGARVIWRQTSASQSAVSARFYVHDLFDGTTAALSTSADATYASRYTAGDGRLAYLDQNDVPHLVPLTGGVESSLSQKAALVIGLSGNWVAAVERSAAGNDLLVTYAITPSLRTEIAAGVDGLPTFSGDTLAWHGSDGVYREDVTEEGVPLRVAETAGAVSASWDLVLWTDSSGQWNPMQGHSLPVFTGLEGIEGDLDLNLPEAATDAQTAAAGDWRDRWLARLVSGSLCVVDRISRPGAAPGCIGLQPGRFVYPGYELYARPTDRATLLFRDGSTLVVKGGTYLQIIPYRPTAERMIQDIVENTFEGVTISRLQQAVQQYQQNGESEALDLGQLGNDLTVIQRLSKELANQLAEGKRAYAARGFTRLPQYFSVMEDVLDFAEGSAERLSQTLNVVQILMSTEKVLNLERYVDQIHAAFTDYFATISRAVKQPDGSQVYVPIDAESAQYLNNSDIFFKMMLHDGRTCFNERNWQARFLTDGTLLFSSAGCPTVSWSKTNIARHMAAADGEVLRRAFLAPLLRNSLRWYQDLSGAFVPGEATLILSLLTANQPIRQIELKTGHIAYVQDIDRARRRTPTGLKLAGSRVLIWGTALEAEMAADGSGAVQAHGGMPVLAGFTASTTNAYGITWQNGTISVSNAGFAPIPERTDRNRPVLVELAPNQGSAVPRAGFQLRLRFSRPMNPTSVTQLGTLTIADAGGTPFFQGALEQVSPAWDGLHTVLTLTPDAAPPVGDYTISLALPPGVVSANGLSVPGSPFSSAFSVVDPIGSAGGQLSTPSGTRLVVPRDALGGERSLHIAAIPVPDTPAGWLPADGLGYTMEPDGQQFLKPVTMTLPLPEASEGAAIMHWTGDGWTALPSWPSPGGISAAASHFSIYAAFLPEASSERILHLPLLSR